MTSWSAPTQGAAEDYLPTLEPPVFSSDGEATDEAMLRMFDRLKTHTTSASTDQISVDDDDDEEGEEDWKDALEEHELPEDVIESNLTIEELQAAYDKSSSLKDKANSLFSSKPPKLSSSLSTYKDALSFLPLRPPTPTTNAPTTKPPPIINSGAQISEITPEEEAEIERLANETVEEKARRELDERVKVLRSILWSNIAAVYLKTDSNKAAAEACTESLADVPTYIKSIHRRSTANIALNTWTSLTAALADNKQLKELLPATSPILPEIRRNLRELPSKIAVLQTKEKDEMMGKLKDLGNSLLGNFGLSTDNFKFEPNENGSYSMNFVR